MNGDTTWETQLRERKKTLECELVELLAKLDELTVRKTDIQKRIDACTVLLLDYGGVDEAPTPQVSVPAMLGATDSDNTLAGMRVVDACATVLARYGKPMKVGELTHAILDGGLSLKSQTPDRSVAIMLPRDARFRRVAPGTFALAEWGIEGPRDTSLFQQTQGVVHRLNREGAVKGAARILKAHGGPMHVNDILRILQEEGFRSNARRPAAMLSGTMKRSPTFRLVGGDTWDLAERMGTIFDETN